VGRTREILLAARAVAAAWAALLLLGYLVERPLLWLIQKTAGGSWAQPVSIFLDLACFFAAGWIAGRLYRQRPVLAVLLFLVSLLFLDFEPLFPLHFGWVLRQISNTMGDSRYLQGLVQAVVSNGMYLAAVWAGGVHSRPKDPLSITR
jgi:hypothetical protein